MLQYILLGAQAAGMITDYAATQQQNAMGRAGSDLDRATINANIETARLQTEQQSLAALKDLRQTIGTQAAIFAARGVQSGVGTQAVLANQSIRQQKSDERIRRMNLLAKEGELRAQNALVGLHQLSSETQLGQALGKRIFNTLPSPSNWDSYKNFFKN